MARTTHLSNAGLACLHDSMAADVADGLLPGLVTLVACGDDVHIDTIGTQAFGDGAALPRDAIFRIASLTKPITAVATMSLVEEGLLRLEEPVDELLPELAHRRVLRAIDAELDDTVPADRPITLEDLLSFRFGFGSVMAPPGSYPIQRAEAELGLQSIGGPPWPPVAHDVDGWIGALGTLPLMYQPGERWLYNTASQVLGVLLARACGQDLETVLRERVFEPLGMIDTGFVVSPDQLSRLTTAYQPDPQTGEPLVLDDPPPVGGAHRPRSRMRAGGSWRLGRRGHPSQARPPRRPGGRPPSERALVVTPDPCDRGIAVSPVHGHTPGAASRPGVRRRPRRSRRVLLRSDLNSIELSATCALRSRGGTEAGCRLRRRHWRHRAGRACPPIRAARCNGSGVCVRACVVWTAR